MGANKLTNLLTMMNICGKIHWNVLTLHCTVQEILRHAI